jgi:hypothetical protein
MAPQWIMPLEQIYNKNVCFNEQKEFFKHSIVTKTVNTILNNINCV